MQYSSYVKYPRILTPPESVSESLRSISVSDVELIFAFPSALPLLNDVEGTTSVSH